MSTEIQKDYNDFSYYEKLLIEITEKIASIADRFNAIGNKLALYHDKDSDEVSELKKRISDLELTIEEYIDHTNIDSSKETIYKWRQQFKEVLNETRR